MKSYRKMSKEELQQEYAAVKAVYNEYIGRDTHLDMSRGKPCKEQLDLSKTLLDALTSDADLICADGTDCRNYGGLTGIQEIKELMADMMEVPAEDVIIYGNSSLNVMYDTISRCMTHGVMGNTPWCKLDKVKFICVVPGYDRHFAITEYFGIENICVPMTPTGPDMDMVEDLVSHDASIKGIWCTPKYSNPTGNSYSDETVRRFARLKPAAQDFRIMWDNAYTVHHLYDHDQDHLIEILAECKRAGNPDLAYKFASTSKITFPGAGIAALATSPNNLRDIVDQVKIQTIGYDKMNQLRHVRFFGDIHGIIVHMEKHADILRPKFEMVENILEKDLGGLDIATWTKPKGGYFISFDTMEGCARAVVSRCKKAGVVLTPAGATYPGGKDPRDCNIRIAPSFPSMEELEKASELLCICTKIESIKKLIADMDAAQAAGEKPSDAAAAAGSGNGEHAGDRAAKAETATVKTAGQKMPASGAGPRRTRKSAAAQQENKTK